jgi:hypothetical protein
VPQSNVTLNVSLDLQHSDAASLDRQISGAVAEVGRQLWTVVLKQLKEVVEAERLPSARLTTLPISFIIAGKCPADGAR